MKELFQGRPPERDRKANWPLIRSNKRWGLKFAVLCLSERVISAPTHHAGRTQPCLKPLGLRCSYCEDYSMRPRWFGYVGGWHRVGKGEMTLGVIELTSSVASQLMDWCDEHGSLRGSILQLSRLNGRANSGLVASVHEGEAKLACMSASIDVEECLSRMWCLERHVEAAEKAAAEGLTAEETVAFRELAIAGSRASRNGSRHGGDDAA